MRSALTIVSFPFRFVIASITLESKLMGLRYFVFLFSLFVAAVWRITWKSLRIFMKSKRVNVIMSIIYYEMKKCSACRDS